MEVFSTLPRAALPWTANALTIATLAAVTWWSAAQRPAPSERPIFAASTSVASAALQPESKDQAQTLMLASAAGRQTTAAPTHAAAAVPAVGHSAEGKAASPLANDAVQPVAFIAAKPR